MYLPYSKKEKINSFRWIPIRAAYIDPITNARWRNPAEDHISLLISSALAWRRHEASNQLQEKRSDNSGIEETRGFGNKERKWAEKRPGCNGWRRSSNRYFISTRTRKEGRKKGLENKLSIAWRGGFMNASRIDVQCDGIQLPPTITRSPTRLGKKSPVNWLCKSFQLLRGRHLEKKKKKKKRKENTTRVQLTRFPPSPCVWSESITPSWWYSGSL